MQVWCMAHPWMTLFLVTLLIVVSGAVAISVVAMKYQKIKGEESHDEG